MTQRSLPSSITVTIGQHSRIYFPFVTTAPPTLDSPGTMTLRAVTLLNLANHLTTGGLHDYLPPDATARVVLIDARELAWQQAKYIGNAHLLLTPDRTLDVLTAIQECLWQRLQGSSPQVSA
jgi:hypothetical protein